MMVHPELMLYLINERHRERIAEADRQRLLAGVRRARSGRKNREVRGRPAGTLASCEPSVAVPARS
jgi:hypothetical protein